MTKGASSPRKKQDTNMRTFTLPILALLVAFTFGEFVCMGDK